MSPVTPFPFCFLLTAGLWLSPPVAGAQPGTAACQDSQGCREMAVQARAAGEFERFHDLAWRAVQTRGARDAELFFLLARAQSLSGRPHDALVTLRRLATEFGSPRDVSGDDDFRRVRNLPGWPELQATIAAQTAPGARGTVAAPEAPPGGSPSAPSGSPAPEADASAVSTPDAEVAAAKSREEAGGARTPRFEEIARFAAPRAPSGGLAYDGVSARFVIGNFPSRKLTIVSADSSRAATLSGDAARLLDVHAIDIDRRQGHLWVVSAGTRTGAAGAGSELHKVQLISGRVLEVFAAEPEDSARFVDVAATRGAVFVLDAGRPRILRPPARGTALVSVIDLPPGAVTSLAPGPGAQHVYVAYADRLVRVDLATATVSSVRAGKGLTLAGFERIRWHRGSLVGIQAAPDEPRRLVRLRLDRGGLRVASAEALDAAAAAPPGTGAVAFDVAGDELYYLVNEGKDASIRRIRLK